jgi:hypothetical protein
VADTKPVPKSLTFIEPNLRVFVANADWQCMDHTYPNSRICMLVHNIIPQSQRPIEWLYINLFAFQHQWMVDAMAKCTHVLLGSCHIAVKDWRSLQSLTTIGMSMCTYEYRIDVPAVPQLDLDLNVCQIHPMQSGDYRHWNINMVHWSDNPELISDVKDHLAVDCMIQNPHSEQVARFQAKQISMTNINLNAAFDLKLEKLCLYTSHVHTHQTLDSLTLLCVCHSQLSMPVPQYTSLVNLRELYVYSNSYLQPIKCMPFLEKLSMLSDEVQSFYASDNPRLHTIEISNTLHAFLYHHPSLQTVYVCKMALAPDTQYPISTDSQDKPRIVYCDQFGPVLFGNNDDSYQMWHWGNKLSLL